MALTKRIAEDIKVLANLHGLCGVHFKTIFAEELGNLFRDPANTMAVVLLNGFEDQLIFAKAENLFAALLSDVGSNKSVIVYFCFELIYHLYFKCFKELEPL